MFEQNQPMQSTQQAAGSSRVHTQATQASTLHAQGFDPARIYVWIRSIESKVNNLVREIDLLKSDFTKTQQKLRREQKVITDDLVELGHKQDETHKKVDLIIKELTQTAGKGEVAVLRKYVELWNPLSFVTQRDLERAVEAATGKKILHAGEENKGERTRKKEISPFQ